MPQFLNKKYIILDSAGIRKPGSRTSGAETFATYHTIEAAHDADIICLVLDGSQPLTHQDQVVAGICKEAKKGVVVIANKADLVDKTARKMFEQSFYHKFAFLKVQKFLWISAQSELEKQKDESFNQDYSNLQNVNRIDLDDILSENSNNQNGKSTIENNIHSIFEQNLQTSNLTNSGGESLTLDSKNSNSNGILESDLENTLESNLEKLETDKISNYDQKLEQMQTQIQLKIDQNLEQNSQQNSQKEMKKLLKAAKNIEKMKKELEKNLEETKLGEFRPQNGIASIWRAIDGSLESRQKDIDPEVVRKLFNYLMKHKDKRPVKLRMQKKAIIYDFLYTKNSPPTFELLVKDKLTIHWSYLRFLENIVRSQFGLQNTGITIKVVEVKKSKILG